MEDALYASVRLMLAVSHGRLVALSTPFGRRGWWWETVWRDDLVADDATWLRVTRTAAQCPRISADFLAEERRTMGWWWYSQEYENAWNDAQTAVFRDEDIQRMYNEDYPVWDLDGAGDGSGFIAGSGSDVRRSHGVALPAHSTSRHTRHTAYAGANDAQEWELGSTPSEPAPTVTAARPLAGIAATIAADAIWRTGQGIPGGRW
jgi:hypothetical protein